MSVHGVDLGTTYSCIATLDRNGNPIVIRNQVDASETLASAVYFENADNVIVGESAKQMVETDSDRVVQFVKRQIGKHRVTDVHQYCGDRKKAQRRADLPDTHRTSSPFRFIAGQLICPAHYHLF